MASLKLQPRSVFRQFHWKRLVDVHDGKPDEPERLPQAWQRLDPPAEDEYVLERIFGLSKPAIWRRPSALLTPRNKADRAPVRLPDARRMQISTMLERWMRHVRQATVEVEELHAPYELQAAVLELDPLLLGTMALTAEELAAADDRLQLLCECLPPPPQQWEALPVPRDARHGEWHRDELEALQALAAVHDATRLDEPEEFVWRMMQVLASSPAAASHPHRLL